MSALFELKSESFEGFERLPQTGRSSEISTSIESDEESIKVLNSIRLLTFNFFLRPPAIKNPQGDCKDDRLEIFIRTQFDNFDVICFQEVFSTFCNRRAYLIESARKAGYEYHAVSPNPNIFHESVIDGGLLIISRLPIVETRFHAFKTAAIMSDVLAMKGALYVKIDLSKVGGDFLHLVTTHTQATYLDSSLELFCESYFCRFHQIKEMRDFILNISKSTSDLLIVCGDMNQNASEQKHSSVYNYLKTIDKTGQYTNIKSLITQEYEALLKALSHQSYKLKDLLRMSKQGGKGVYNPQTFAEWYVDENGKKVAAEPHLHNIEDYCSGQSLDYIFELQVNDHNPSKQLDVDRTKVQKFELNSEDKKYKFKHVSDHYGVSAVII